MPRGYGGSRAGGHGAVHPHERIPRAVGIRAASVLPRGQRRGASARRNDAGSAHYCPFAPKGARRHAGRLLHSSAGYAVSNPAEEALLLSPAYQEKLGEAIADGAAEYFRLAQAEK